MPVARVHNFLDLVSGLNRALSASPHEGLHHGGKSQYLGEGRGLKLTIRETPRKNIERIARESIAAAGGGAEILC